MRRRARATDMPNCIIEKFISLYYDVIVEAGKFLLGGQGLKMCFRIVAIATLCFKRVEGLKHVRQTKWRQ
jgi:hypothetical protein